MTYDWSQVSLGNLWEEPPVMSEEEAAEKRAQEAASEELDRAMYDLCCSLFFNADAARLPTCDEFDGLLFDCLPEERRKKAEKGFSGRLQCRFQLTQNSYILPVEENILLLLDVIGDCLSPGSPLAELGCGAGWLTYWLRRYGLEDISAVDAGGWDDYWKVLPPLDPPRIVADGPEWLEEHPEISLVLICWPCWDGLTERTWQAMKTGQTLLYIGERGGGATATEWFFRRAKRSFVKKIPIERAFFGFEDDLYVFQKVGRRRRKAHAEASLGG